jgi:hypothetical protein
VTIPPLAAPAHPALRIERAEPSGLILTDINCVAYGFPPRRGGLGERDRILAEVELRVQYVKLDLRTAAAGLQGGRDVARKLIYFKASSTAFTTAGSSGVTPGSKRAKIVPSLAIRNFVKFHRMSPPVLGFWSLSVRYS